MGMTLLLKNALLLLAFPLSLLLTQGVIGLAQKRGWVAKPKADRWHQKPTALFGGVAIFATFALGGAFLQGLALRADLLGLLLGGAIIFLVGLLDDRKPLNPLVKFFGQAMAVSPFLAGFILTNPTPTFIFALPLLLFWMLTLTNSLNLLDNMDGLSAGTAATAAALLAFYANRTGQASEFSLAALLTLACLGFLVFNFRLKSPAKIFMGDCGSMFLGYILAGLSAIVFSANHAPLVVGIAAPLLLLAVPLFDTTLVVIIRKREGRAVSQGGRDHTSHRLVYAGFSEKGAALTHFGLTLLFGGAGIALALHKPFALLAAVPLTVLFLARLGVSLSRFSQPQTAVVSVSPPAPAAYPRHSGKKESSPRPLPPQSGEARKSVSVSGNEFPF